MSDPRKKSVFIASPGRPGKMIHRCVARGIYAWPMRDKSVEISVTELDTSVLPWTFDNLWCMAVNGYEKGQYTHFAMHHDDIGTTKEGNWLGILLAEMEEYDADIMSAVVPLKGEEGLTSTGIDDTGDPWNPRRLTLAEIYELSETFTHPQILLNTGLWVCDLSKPWVHKERNGVMTCSFHQRNQVVRTPNGWEPRMRSEDWELSRDVRDAGGKKLYATRKVKLYHEYPGFTNAEPWGTCKRDPCHPLPELAGVG